MASMDRTKKKSKTFVNRSDEKNRISSYNQDLKTINENIRISEILRNVKISSSFRVKGPKGTKVMADYISDKSNIDDTNDNLDASVDNITGEMDQQNETEEFTEEAGFHKQSNDQNYSKDQNSMVSTTGEHILQDVEKDVIQTDDAGDSIENDHNLSEESITGCQNELSNKDKKGLADICEVFPTGAFPRIEVTKPCRKLSLDNTSLNRRESLSEMDLNLVGRNPLQRKSSFFRKKLDSFVRNTSEVFKRQTSRQSTNERRGSFSFSMQSLTDHTAYAGNDVLLESKPPFQCTPQGSTSSLDQESATTSSICSLADSQRSQQSTSGTPGSMQSLNELNLNDAMVSGRAFSVSSGLDSVHRPKRSQSSRNNRYTWVASNTVEDFFRRLGEKEKNSCGEENELKPHELHASHSFHDISRVSEPIAPVAKTDSKGRRLSYQRAVSGEDPVLPTPSFRRRNKVLENAELVAQANRELNSQLAEFSRNGVPPLKGFTLSPIPDGSMSYLHWAEDPGNLETVYDFHQLDDNEASRQAVIKELIFTEAGYIKHLKAIVEVFIAAAHALQDSGKLLDLDTERLFSNIPDVLNASLFFWNASIYPMVQQSVENKTPYSTSLMYPGFFTFRDIFMPYERYVSDQSKGLDYLRSMNQNSDFNTYLSWCHRQNSCKRLQLSDILVKPMQRLTKYSLILRRIILHTEDDQEKTSLIAMEAKAKNYVLDLNRTIRQKEEIEKMETLAHSIESYDVDYKDEEMDRVFRMYANVNLRAPMAGCLPTHNRSLVHEGDLRFRDNCKEQKVEVRAILLTDMLLICKKSSSKTHGVSYKMIRPKFMMDKMIHFPQFKNTKNKQEITSIICLMLDDVGTSYHCFVLSEPSKDSNSNILKIWEQKLREAKLSYELGVWFAKNPSRDLSELDMDTSEYTKSGLKANSEELSVEREARERVATMLHRCMGASTDYDYSQASLNTDSFEGEASAMSGARTPGHGYLYRHQGKRASTGGSSRNSRLSSFQQSTSAASHDEPHMGSNKYSFKCGSSVEHLIVPQNPEDETRSITVNVLSESETETVIPKQPTPPPPTYSKPTAARSPTMGHHTLKVQPQCGVMALVHSLPDLSIDAAQRPSDSVSVKAASMTPQTASEKLYQSHQEALSRNRLSARPHSGSHFLSPDNRGTSYPPPSPTRASLRRGLAFSYSFKNPPLSKMGHVKSEYHQPTGEHQHASGSAVTVQFAKPIAKPSTSAEKGAINPVLVGSSEKKSSKSFTSRSSKESRSVSPSKKEDEKREEDSSD